jgi:bifunctional non-homologous end joining protein LigD
MPKPPRFITPAQPVLRPEPPTGKAWQHQLKMDGFRAQAHLREGAATIYGKNGGDLTRRFNPIAKALLALPAQSAILDGELIACNPDGTPSFQALMAGGRHGICCYVFDLIEIDGRDLRPAPLEERLLELRKLLKRANTDTLRFSDTFKDPIALLDAAERHGLEGIVSKLKESPYSSGPTQSWIKVKTKTWRALNHDRWRYFNR